MTTNKDKNSIHLGGNDLLNIDQDGIEFDKWVLERAEQQKFKLENQLENLEPFLSPNIYAELKDNRVFIHYKKGVTFEIEMPTPTLSDNIGNN